MANLTLALTEPVSAPVWLNDVDAPAQIKAALNGQMHRERWKYTKSQPILDMLTVQAAAPEFESLPVGVHLETISRTTNTAPVQAGFSDAPEACSAFCYQESVFVLRVEGEISTPLKLSHQGHTAPLIIKLADNASVQLEEIYANDADQHQTLWLQLGRGSKLVHSRNTFNGGQHWQYLRAELAQDSNYSLHNHVSGSQLRRQDIQIICHGAGAHADIVSAAFIPTGNHLDQQITVEHAAPNTSSTQVFHNIADSKAKVTFNGRIHIHKQCEGVDANLSNKNLCIGDNATINTKPELEIYTDDVKCAHGTTIGQIADDHMFYCASRGIAPDAARNLLAQAFLNVCTTGPTAETALSQFGAVALV